MERELRMVIVADTNTEEARQLIASLSENPAIPQTVVTPALVRRIIPIRANPAVGVMFWSNDLQGLAADVEAFAAYVKGEAAIKAAAHVAQRYIPDDIALAQPRVLVADWAPDTAYQPGDKVYRNDTLYNIEQETVSSAVYPPEAEGMLAIYRPIVPEATGTLDDPIPWVYGMDCEAGLYYLYEGVTYRALSTMKPCTWTPGSEGAETVWEVSADEVEAE